MDHFLTDISVAPTWLWLAFSAGIVILLLIDLSLFRDDSHKISRKAALTESALWVMMALSFNLWFGYRYGHHLGVEFLTGYLVEKSLSVDNLFVILLIFGSFRIPAQYQHRVLFFGVLGAIVLRAFFILVGAELLQHFHWILYIFGGILILTAIKFLRDSETQKDVTDSIALTFIKKIMPTTDKMEGHNFFLVENGVRKATPLFLALVVIEMTDLVFAVDSIPAVFAVTQDAFVAFASNILAILGLRALYFVLADWVAELRYLKPGLAAVLGFIGVKMVLMDVYKVPSWISLIVIFLILLVAGVSSWYGARKRDMETRG